MRFDLPAVRVSTVIAIAAGALLVGGAAIVPFHAQRSLPCPVVAAAKPAAPAQKAVDRKAAAYAALLAARQAIADDDAPVQSGRPVPLAIPARQQAYLAALREYRAVAPADDAVAMTFLEGATLRRYGHLDEALALFAEILDHHLDHETAEYAASLALDSYRVLGRDAELGALARRLGKERHFLADKPELADNVRKITRRIR